MKFNLNDDSKNFVYGVLKDIEIAASIKNNKKFRKFAARLKDKFKLNSSYVDLKYNDFREIKNTVSDAVDMLKNSLTNQEQMKGETEEEQKAIQTKLDQITELHDKAVNAFSELEGVEELFGENLMKIAEETRRHNEKNSGLYES